MPVEAIAWFCGRRRDESVRVVQQLGVGGIGRGCPAGPVREEALPFEGPLLDLPSFFGLFETKRFLPVLLPP